MINLKPEPLTASAFKTFGDVVDIEGCAPTTINQGFAQRFSHLASVDVTAEDGRVNISLVTAKARTLPMDVRIMERHPLGTQIFYPLQDRMWTVIVCGDPRDYGSYRAFSATGRQGINYGRSTWHHPLIASGADSWFFIVDRIGPGSNLEEFWLPEDAALKLMP